MFNKLLSAAAFAALLLAQVAISAPQVSSPGSLKPCMFLACISSLHRSSNSLILRIGTTTAECMLALFLPFAHPD
ncbi:hypothetical protein B0H19DRAFT_1182869 [Mycena capillaripes]|nr:hypothetical protein B0H19DRAFT_1182869 [Mycena capillaripes]